MPSWQYFLINWNCSKGKTYYSWASILVKKVPRFKLWRLWKHKNHCLKFTKEKAFKIAYPIWISNVLKTLQTSKQKWWGMLTCYYKPPLNIFWQALVEENKCHILLFIWKYQNCQKLKKSNKLLLETFSNWAQNLTNA